MHHPLSRAARRAAALALAVCAVPSVAAAADELSLVDATEPVGPGITLRHHQFLTATGWTDAQILRVDLSRPAVTGDLLTAGPSINDRGPVSAMVNRRGAVAGVNGDFFDIDGAGGPLGTAVQGGELLKGNAVGRTLHAGVGRDGIGGLVDTTLAATAVLNGSPRAVRTLNTPSAAIPADTLVAFTPRWGDADRHRGLQGVPAAELAEVVVAGGTVVSVSPDGIGRDPIPADGFTLVGRGADAEALRDLEAGDPVVLSYRLADPVARRLRFAVGGSAVLVRDGRPQPIADPSSAPRTGIGFSRDGRTMWLVTADGRQAQVPGPTLTAFGELLAGLGADSALNLDGGGSTTMLARGLGDPLASVRNTPSDGRERDDPNGVGVFVAPGDGRVDDLVLRPAAPRVFPGLHRTLSAAAVDDHQTPVALPAGDVRWSVARGTVAGGVLRARGDASGTLRVHAEAGRAAADTAVRVLGRLDRLELSQRRLALPDADTPATVAVTGRDAEGYAAPVELADLDLDYDRTVLRVRPAPGGLELQPRAGGATVLRATVGGVTATLPVTVGVRTQTVYGFDAADEPARWRPNGTAPAEQRLSLRDGKLRLDYSARRNQGITYADDAGIALPGQPLTVRLRLTGSAAQQFGSLYWREADGRSRNQLVGPLKVGAQAVEWRLPSDVRYPIAVTGFQTIETDAAKQAPGSVDFDALEVDTAPDVTAPAADPPRPDPLVSVDGRLPRRGWRFATLSDVQFTAAVPELAKVATAALARIRADRPDLVVLNGDITDTGTEADMALARKVLEDGGCALVAVGEENDPVGPGKVPCLYVPGNHESYGAGSSQGDLSAFRAQFGPAYRTFDHKGTRFVLLDSSLGTLRRSAFEQLPRLAATLRAAATDPAVDNVLVFAHHPVRDPSEGAASQLGDPLETRLVQGLLTDFRERSGKGVAMTGSHAQVVDVHREEGVPYTVLPSSGKGPYGTPDRGGFTGYLRFNVDPQRRAAGPWLRADVRAFAQSVTVRAPATLAQGATAALSGSIVQPDGVAQTGTRVVPLRYPMSVRWGGSRTLQVGGTVAAARRAGKVALLRPATRRLVAIRPGRVTVTVTNESMRTDTTAPVVGSATVRVTRFAADAGPGDDGAAGPGEDDGGDGAAGPGSDGGDGAAGPGSDGGDGAAGPGDGGDGAAGPGEGGDGAAGPGDGGDGAAGPGGAGTGPGTAPTPGGPAGVGTAPAPVTGGAPVRPAAPGGAAARRRPVARCRRAGRGRVRCVVSTRRGQRLAVRAEIHGRRARTTGRGRVRVTLPARAGRRATVRLRVATAGRGWRLTRRVGR